MGRTAIALVACFILSACSPQDARLHLQHDIQAQTIDIIHARFPCRSPDLHFFGYRFRVQVKNEYGYGDVCWDLLSRSWSWYILPEYPLSNLNIRSNGKRADGF